MSPYDRMAELYVRHPQERSFDFYLNWHLRYGYVFSTPTLFVMGRATIKDAPIELHEITPDLPNCWYLHALAGDPCEAWRFLPYPLPWVGFERLDGTGQRVARYYPSSTLARFSQSVVTA